jgi:hypothetical protein
MRSSPWQLELDFYPHRPPFSLVRHADPHAPKRRKLEVRRDRLMGRVTTLKSELERLDREADELSRRAALLIDPVRDEMQAALGNTMGLFEELLGPNSGLSRSDKRTLNQVFECVSTSLIEKMDALPEIEDRTNKKPRHRHTRTAAGSLGEMFKQLAVVLHPDLAKDEAERERRHAIMREVTKAYGAKDLARLVELQDGLRRGVAAGFESTPNGEVRMRRLAATNRALERQQQSLRRRVAMLGRLRWGRIDGRGEFIPNDALQAVLGQSRRVIADLGEVENLLKRFAEGESTLVEMLLALPESLVAQDGENELDD